MNSLDQWFVAEILPHEAALMRYLHRVWPNRSEASDLCQEIYIRVYESAGRDLPRMPKSFLFATARNLLTDLVRRDRVVSIDYTADIAALNVLVDEISPEERLSSRQELRRLADALDSLSDQCRAVIWLRRVEGLSQREAAQRLGIDEGALEGYMSRGVRALTKAVFGGGGACDGQWEARSSDRETGRG